MNIHNRKFRLACIVSAALLAALLACTGVLECVRQSTAAALADQQAAARWGAETAQLSCYFATGYGFVPGRIYSIEKSVDEAMSAASLAAGENARLWFHAYSADTSLYAQTTRASATLHVTAFGGDYFYIHQPKLLSGSYLSSGGENAGYIFLDKNAAWKLFGALDVVGMSVTLADYEYIVCGVGDLPSGTLYDAAYGDAPRAYILVDSLAASSVKEMTTYEIVLPNQIDGFARSVVEDIFTDTENTVIVENSARFGVRSLLSHLSERTKLGVRTSSVTYPWYENVAIVTEYRCATLLSWEIALLSIAALLVLTWIVVLWTPTTRALKRLLIAAWEAVVEKYNALTRPKKYRNT